MTKSFKRSVANFKGNTDKLNFSTQNKYMKDVIQNTILTNGVHF